MPLHVVCLLLCGCLLTDVCVIGAYIHRVLISMGADFTVPSSQINQEKLRNRTGLGTKRKGRLV